MRTKWGLDKITPQERKKKEKEDIDKKTNKNSDIYGEEEWPSSHSICALLLIRHLVLVH